MGALMARTRSPSHTLYGGIVNELQWTAVCRWGRSDLSRLGMHALVQCVVPLWVNGLHAGGTGNVRICTDGALGSCALNAMFYVLSTEIRLVQYEAALKQPVRPAP